MPLFDKKDKSRYATFTRRTLGMGAGMTAVFGVLAGQLYQLQILHGDEYKADAENNRVSERLVAPPRGRILDRFGLELANIRRNYRVLLVAEQASDGVEQAVDTIAKIIAITDAQKKRILATIAGNKKFVPVPVAENLSWEEFSRISEHLPYLPGVQADPDGQTRDYPFGDKMVHLLGYVGSVSPEDMAADNDPLLNVPGYRIGKRGIEKVFEKEVRGTAGAVRDEVDARGRVIRELGRDKSTIGQDVWLTIDGELQKYATERMGDQSGALIVTDVTTGDILAFSSTPGYDPNEFNVGITPDEWRTLTEDDHLPLLNKAMSGIYPPGSTFKPVVAAAAIDAGLATSDYRVTCNGRLTLGNHTFNCWAWTTYHRGHGSLDVEGGIKNSCDVFFYETARRLGIDKIQETALKLGLGAPTGIEIPGEKSGFIPSTAWKLKRYKTPWQPGDTLSAGIGQGYVTATPLQLALEATRIASGRAVQPRVVHQVGNQLRRGAAAPPLAISPDALARVREGMNQVMNEPGGTAYAFRGNPEPGFEMAGKTGTAQVRAYTQAEHVSGITKNSALQWKLRDHALFIGFAPVAAPRYACACLIEHGAEVAHPQVLAARDVLTFAQKRKTLDLPTAYPTRAAELGPGKVVR